jgi:excisionase family DNA binding protein
MIETMMMTVSEACVELGLTRPQVYRRIDQGVLTAVRARRNGKQCLLISTDAVARFKGNGIDLAPEDPPGLLRVGQAAQLLCCSVERVRTMVASGELDAKRGDSPRSQIRILRSSVDEYLAGE